LEDFYPASGVSPEARVRIEREVESLRIRLESELSAGAQRLRRIKWEIETSRGILMPDLSLARREFAQAEKDLEVASKHDSSTLALIALVFAFLIGWVIDLNRSPAITYDEPAEAQRENSGNQPPHASRLHLKLGEIEGGDALVIALEKETGDRVRIIASRTNKEEFLIFTDPALKRFIGCVSIHSIHEEQG